MEFLRRHRRRLERISYNDRSFFAGSSSEIPAAYFLTKPTDLDFMMYRANVCAVPKDVQPPNDFKGEVLTIDPTGLSAGYVRLKKSNLSGQEEDYEKQSHKFQFETVNGPAVTTTVGWASLTFDRVISMQCPYWPSEATEWRTRHRPSGWPSKDLIDEIVSDGCFLVGKSHPSIKGNDDTQWRYSFSKAEMRLISSWTDSQKYVYHVLRHIKSEIIKGGGNKKTGLRTYHLKTQMLWACEKKPAEFWEDDNLLSSLCILLTEMEHQFSNRNLPNYFLPDCNIIKGNFAGDDFKHAVSMLNTESVRSILPPKLCKQCHVTASFPVTVGLYIHLWAERFGVPYQAHRPKLDKVRQIIRDQLDHLMNGIYNVQLGKTLGARYYEIAEEQFLTGIAERVDTERAQLSHRASVNAITALYESLENIEILVEGQNKWDFSAAISCTKELCPYDGKSLSVPWNEASGIFDKRWINPTRLLFAVYLSNLYFTTGRYEKCNGFLEEELVLALNANFTEFFPMIFCPELASLFDENIQEVLGLVWLIIHLSGAERIFEFYTCPQLFMHYIRIQSSLKLESLDSYAKDVTSFHEHCQHCKYGLHLFSCHYVLPEMAWKIARNVCK